ncbi:type II toxin-antitoxin system RelE/ParE family toxin [Streptomyces sp. NPDC023588]|uniref:type II toxin-antitoxin system RelE family toxin n=1 Tax=Streptomyces sp. NPDC023588 TaxID=3154907 RepID=UPI0033E7EDB7
MTRRGKQVAAVVSIEVLRKYLEWEEREINRIIDERMANPADALGFNTTALVSHPERRRLRVGDYRVVYTIDNGELVVWSYTSGIASPFTTPDADC